MNCTSCWIDVALMMTMLRVKRRGGRITRAHTKPPPGEAQALELMAQRLEAGTVWVNCWLLRDLRVPFGGMKHSGVGREGGDEALRFFTEAKNVCMKLRPQ